MVSLEIKWNVPYSPNIRTAITRMRGKTDFNREIPAEPFLLKTLSDFFATVDVLKNNVSPTGMTKKIERRKKKFLRYFPFRLIQIWYRPTNQSCALLHLHRKDQIVQTNPNSPAEQTNREHLIINFYFHRLTKIFVANDHDFMTGIYSTDSRPRGLLYNFIDASTH